MSSAQALIVDDSRTAQYQLKKMLEKYDLSIDTALSAEEALERLQHKQPSVIFLDHHMKGMDGFSALKIIKDNPDTALIPVIMYTSEKGSVYVGQARALGAQDILTKGAIQPASLERVLHNLNLIELESEPDTQDSPASAPVNTASSEIEETEHDTAPDKRSAPPKYEHRDRRRQDQCQQRQPFGQSAGHQHGRPPRPQRQKVPVAKKQPATRPPVTTTPWMWPPI